MTTTSTTHHPDSSRGLSLKSPWRSPREGYSETQQQRRREVLKREAEKTPARADDLPKLSKTLSDFSIAHSDRLAWSPQYTHSPVPLSFQHPNLPQTTPPRMIPHCTLASPFKSGGTRSHVAMESDRERSRWDIPILSRSRWRARSGSVIADANTERLGIGATKAGYLRMDVSPQTTLMDSSSTESTHSDRVRKWTEATKIAASSPSFDAMRIVSSVPSQTPPSMTTQIVSTMSASLGNHQGYAGTPTSPTPPPPPPHLQNGRRSAIPSTPEDAMETISSPLTRTTASLPRRSYDQARYEGSLYNQRHSSSCRKEVKRIRDDGIVSPLDAGVIDIFFDHGGVSCSSSGSSDSSPIQTDRHTVIRPRLLKRRTTSGESGGWSIATKRSMSSTASKEITLPLTSKPNLETRTTAEKIDERMSPLGEKFGHGTISPKLDDSPLHLARKRLSPGDVEDELSSSRRHPPTMIAPRPAIFRHITAPVSTSLRHINRVSTPDPIEIDRSQTPLPAFVAERPSPFAFVSSGLVKKGTPSSMSNRSTAGSSGMSSNASKHAMDNPSITGLHRFPSSTLTSVIMPNDLPDTPIKAAQVVEGLPRIVNNRPPPVDIAAASASRGLRRKRSAMWNRAHSGSVSSVGGSDGFEPEPTTPTMEEDLAAKAIQELCTITPEPPKSVQSYPFASNCVMEKGKPIESPSPPHKRFSILSRLKSTKQQHPLARASNPFLSLAYKLGAEQPMSITCSPMVSQSIAEKTTAGRFEQDFVVLEPVGQGEFSTVWKVREKRSGDIFAVKRGKAYCGAKDRQRQLQEVDILQSLSSHPHPHVVEFHEAWEQNHQLHLRTAFADCGDLATYLLSIADAGGLDEIRCWKVLTEMTCGLRHIHNLGILHLDLKPSNILITKSGSLQISDFGLSTRQGDTTSERACSRQQLGPSSSDASLREGDREYLSPEILRGEFGRAADAFSLGITMLEVFMNVILPSNGDAWQKLRSDDFSDLNEHFAISRSPIATSFGAMSTSLQSMTSLGSCTTYAEDSASPSATSPLLTLIKRLMVSDPTTRMTIDGIWSHPIIYRIAGMLSTCIDSRMSGEAHSTYSADEWSTWENRRMIGTSPDATKVEFVGRGMSIVQSALVVEVDTMLWDEVLVG